ncbi:hypothetical protein KIPB_008976 [Kipferlia bialata]|uniref:non-specific serine/threonine protein kinase n=1 Tax=Kipferlia bialata TaxID=797122 RepID=A0A9K3D4B1_9EUKA|nr:hypothetical protein KIPB_008976 [Kipferlia bialata]|eukprot:g8976.t1
MAHTSVTDGAAPSRPASAQDFHNIKVLGTGAFGSVYLAERIHDGVKVAIKRIDMLNAVRNLPREEKTMFMERLDAEIGLLKDLALAPHKNIVLYHDSFLDDATSELCVVMEYVKVFTYPLICI